MYVDASLGSVFRMTYLRVTSTYSGRLRVESDRHCRMDVTSHVESSSGVSEFHRLPIGTVERDLVHVLLQFLRECFHFGFWILSIGFKSFFIDINRFAVPK